MTLHQPNANDAAEVLKLASNQAPDIDISRLLAGLRELSRAFVDGQQGRYGMRIPAEPYRDGDLVCGGAARSIERMLILLSDCVDALKDLRFDYDIDEVSQAEKAARDMLATIKE